MATMISITMSFFFSFFYCFSLHLTPTMRCLTLQTERHKYPLTANVSTYNINSYNWPPIRWVLTRHDYLAIIINQIDDCIAKSLSDVTSQITVYCLDLPNTWDNILSKILLSTTSFFLVKESSSTPWTCRSSYMKLEHSSHLSRSLFGAES